MMTLQMLRPIEHSGLINMGFNKRILPDTERLQNLVYDYGVVEVIKRYEKADMLMGSVESMAYLQNIIREYELGK